MSQPIPAPKIPTTAAIAALVLCLSTTAAATPRLVVAMADAGGSVQMIDPSGTSAPFEPFGPSFLGGVRVAAADIDGDGNAEIISGSGPGIPARVQIHDGSSLQPVGFFDPFTPSFTGGVYVAVGDVDGDGRPDIIVGQGSGGAPRVVVHDGQSLQLKAAFDAYEPAFLGGVRVAAGDVNGDGIDDIVTAPAAAGPQVKVFDGRSGALVHAFGAFTVGFWGGVNVAVGDWNGDGRVDIAAASAADPTPGTGGGPHVKVFDGRNLTLLADFRPYNAAFTGGVFVGMRDVNGDGLADLITAPGSGGAPELTRWLAPDASEAGQLPVFTPGFTGGVHVSADSVIPTILRDGFE